MNSNVDDATLQLFFVSSHKVSLDHSYYYLVLLSPNSKYSSQIYLLYYTHVSVLKQTVLEKIRKKTNTYLMQLLFFPGLSTKLEPMKRLNTHVDLND